MPDIVFGAGRNVVTKTHLSTGQVQDITPIPLKGADVASIVPSRCSSRRKIRTVCTIAANRLYETTDCGRFLARHQPGFDARESRRSPASVGSFENGQGRQAARRHLCGERLPRCAMDSSGPARTMD